MDRQEYGQNTLGPTGDAAQATECQRRGVLTADTDTNAAVREGKQP